jgi:hypothetical protein
MKTAVDGCADDGRPTDSPSLSDGRHPKFETSDVIRWVEEKTGLHVRGEVPTEQPLHPQLRPPVPVLTAMDDGSYVKGEEFRVRDNRFVIGRTEGDLVIPNDKTISAKHAEIIRREHRGVSEWMLSDLDTANGTFVRVNSALLYDDIVIVLGRHRFRLDSPTKHSIATGNDGTQLVDKDATQRGIWPILVELGKPQDGLRFELRQPCVTIGRFGGKCDIMLDDPHLAGHHATIEIGAKGRLTMRAEKSINGVWANIRSVTLTNLCFFRCGEQVFRFEVP